MEKLLDNYNSVLGNIRKIKNNSPSFPEDFKLIAVSKTFGENIISKLLEEGHRVFGENKIQEAENKWSNLKKKFKNIDLHFIGPLQSNKAKKALEIFNCIHSIDREKLVKKINDIFGCNEELKSKNHKFFVQVNTGDEEQKSGIRFKDTIEFVKWSKYEQNLNVVGLMCIPPITQDSTFHFIKLKKLSDELELPYTSMGMTNDYEQAIKCGATHIRVGSAIFGKRQ
mgnify:CR=1 FL=1